MSASEREQLSTLVALVRYTSALGTQSEYINRSEHIIKCVCSIMIVCCFIIALDVRRYRRGTILICPITKAALADWLEKQFIY